MISSLAPGTACSARTLISSSDSIVNAYRSSRAERSEVERSRSATLKAASRDLKARPRPLCGLRYGSTPLGMTTRVSSLPLHFRRLKKVKIRRRFQIVCAKRGHRKFARLRSIKMGGLVRAGQFLTVDFALQFHEGMQQ